MYNKGFKENFIIIIILDNEEYYSDIFWGIIVMFCYIRLMYKIQNEDRPGRFLSL